MTGRTGPTTTIRPANTDDAPALAALAERTFRETFGPVNTAANMDLHCRSSYGELIQAREIADPARLTLLCHENDRLIGYAQLRWSAPPACVTAKRPGEIQRLYVDQPWHGRGIARDLMAACLAAMTARGSDVVWLGVWERNPRAIAFYRKCGFVAAGNLPFVLGHDLQRDLVMLRPVADPRGA
jgi:ribosomal protein S18 acetylase RimI-like enzyme